MTENASRSRWHSFFLLAGPVTSLLFVFFVHLDSAHPEVSRTAAVALWMVIWWITEVVPLAVTALLPVVFFPLLGIMSGKAVSVLYVNWIIFLFIGGFLVALAMEKWNLHRRIALRTLLLFGSSPRYLLLGFMVTTAFLSMWISNTATTMMMVPIVIAVILGLEESSDRTKVRRFAVGLLLGVAYAASVGGIATLIGTPPNLSFVRILAIQFPQAPEISFSQWFFFAFPLSVLFLLFIWLFLSWRYLPREGIVLKKSFFQKQLSALGKICFEERVVLVDFIGLALLWLLRKDIVLGAFTIPGWSNLFGHKNFINDGTVAVAAALVLFVVPARQEKGKAILDWETAAKLPWGIVLLFGGGFALASGFKESGLSVWIAYRLQSLSHVSPVLILLTICLLVTFLTELTSNTATTEMILPILAALAVAIKVHPYLLMIPATLSASCAFMLPVATPPNAIIFGTDRVKVAQMARSGLWLNLVGVLLITFLMLFLGKSMFGIHFGLLPSWAKL